MNYDSRFWSKVLVGDDCWEWQAGLTKGYGSFWIGGRKGRPHGAHTVAYETMVGPVPEGLELDHLCFNPRCVRPDHLEPVTHQENTRRRSARTTHCPQGHEYIESTTYRWRGRRYCRLCHRDTQARYLERSC